MNYKVLSQKIKVIFN